MKVLLLNLIAFASIVGFAENTVATCKIEIFSHSERTTLDQQAIINESIPQVYYNGAYQFEVIYTPVKNGDLNIKVNYGELNQYGKLPTLLNTDLPLSSFKVIGVEVGLKGAFGRDDYLAVDVTCTRP